MKRSAGITFGNGKVKILVRFNQELIPKVLDIEAASERVVISRFESI